MERQQHFTNSSTPTTLDILWRQTQEETFSDWAIIIHAVVDNQDLSRSSAVTPAHTSTNICPTKDTENAKERVRTDLMTVYHVHRVYLAAGECRSGYFYNLFKDGGRFSESGERTSEIHLPSQAAEVFPDFLDFLYTGGSVLRLTPKTMVGLKSLADYFDVQVLSVKVAKYWKSQIRIETLDQSYDVVVSVGDAEMKDYIIRMAANSLVEGVTSQPVYPPSFQRAAPIKTKWPFIRHECFWLGFVDHLKQIQKETYATRRNEMSEALSVSVAEYLASADCISSETWHTVTDTLILPVIHYSAAGQFLQAESSKVRQVQSSQQSEISSVTQRCITSLSENLEKLTNIEREALKIILLQQPSMVLTDLVLKSAVAMRASR